MAGVTSRLRQNEGAINTTSNQPELGNQIGDDNECADYELISLRET